MAVQPTVLMFDLGGVLVDNATFDELPKLLPAPMAPGALFDRYLASRAVRLYERGLIEAHVFAQDFVEEWGLSLSPDAFLAQFTSWPRAPYPGAVELLASLRQHYTVAILSNCNATHWGRFCDLTAQAHHPYSSHLLGMVKPDRETFEAVIARLDRPAGEIVFLDDSETNIRCARAAGLNAHHAVGFDAVKRTLGALGILPLTSPDAAH